MTADYWERRALMAEANAAQLKALMNPPPEKVFAWVETINDERDREIRRLKAERLKLDKRIRCQRQALRQNWQIIEMRASYKRAWYPSPLLKSMLRRHLNKPEPWWSRMMTRALDGISANAQFRRAR